MIDCCTAGTVVYYKICKKVLSRIDETVCKYKYKSFRFNGLRVASGSETPVKQGET